MIKCLLVFAIFYISAYFAGEWGDVIMTKFAAKRSAVFNTAFGGCALITVSLLACFVSGVFHVSSTVCALIAAAFAAALIISGIAAKKRCAGRGDSKKPLIGKEDIIMTAAAAGIIALQVFAVMFFRYENSAAIRGVGEATRIFEEGSVSLTDPMTAFIGVAASVLHMHPLKVIYSLLPPIMITLCYLCYISLICTICTGGKRVTAFATLVLLNLWGYQSDVLILATLLLSWFGIWTFIVHGILGILAVILIRYIQNRPEDTAEDGTEDSSEDIPEEWDMKKHRIINARNLAIALGILAFLLLGAVFVLNSKINRLYDATVNLQTDMNRRCSIYEFAPEEGTVMGYLIKGSDGTVTFIGGGPKSNADALGEFFDRYGNTVTNWYVYGDDEENCGAMRELVDSMRVNVTKVFVIERKEMEKR